MTVENRTFSKWNFAPVDKFSFTRIKDQCSIRIIFADGSFKLYIWQYFLSLRAIIFIASQIRLCIANILYSAQRMYGHHVFCCFRERTIRTSNRHTAGHPRSVCYYTQLHKCLMFPAGAVSGQTYRTVNVRSPERCWGLGGGRSMNSPRKHLRNVAQLSGVKSFPRRNIVGGIVNNSRESPSVRYACWCMTEARQRWAKWDSRRFSGRSPVYDRYTHTVENRKLTGRAVEIEKMIRVPFEISKFCFFRNIEFGFEYRTAIGFGWIIYSQKT